MREEIKKAESLEVLKFLIPHLCNFLEGWGLLDTTLEIDRETFIIKIKPVE